MFKSLNGETSEYLSKKFILRNDTTSHRLRNSEMRLALPQPRTDYFRKSFSYSGAELWKSFPVDIRTSKTRLELFQICVRHGIPEKQYLVSLFIFE